MEMDGCMQRGAPKVAKLYYRDVYSYSVTRGQMGLQKKLMTKGSHIVDEFAIFSELTLDHFQELNIVKLQFTI